MNDRTLDAYVAIGGDRYLAPSEAGLEGDPLGRRAWDVYDRHFGRFTGAGLDPELRRLRHAGRRLSMPRLTRGATVIVVGPEPLHPAEREAIARQRDHALVVAVPASLASLRETGLVADWLLIEGPDARAAEALPVDAGTTLLLARHAEAPRGADPDSMRVAPSLPSWGVPLATAAALALMAGAGGVAIAGLRPPASAGQTADKDADALWALLDLIAALAPGRLALTQARGATTSAIAAPWRRGWIDAPPASGVPRVEWVDHGPCEQLLEQARADLARLGPVLAAARPALDAAFEARAVSETSRPLMRAVETILAWGADPVIRASVQEGLGLSFLPRLWRTGISMDPAIRPWRPLVLALHELLEQSERLSRALAHVAGAEAAPRSSRRADNARDAKPPRVSAIVPVIGGVVQGLRDAIHGLVKQTYRDVEVIVVHDAASAVAVTDALRDVDTSVRLVETPGGSLAEALNAATHAATGELIAHHDLDGVSHPERIARQAAWLQRHPLIDVVAAATIDLDLAPGAPGRLCDGRAYTPEALAKLLPDACPFVHGSVMVRREVLLEAGGYRDVTAGASTIDHDLWLRQLPRTRFAKLPTQLYARRGSLARAAALAPARARDGHAPAGAERPLADPQAGRGLPALELGKSHEA